MKGLLLTGVISLFVIASGLVYAQNTQKKPKEDVSASKHPNLAAAQVDIEHAWNKILAAQKANEFDLAGHAAKAKDLIDQANKELKLAAETANK